MIFVAVRAERKEEEQEEAKNRRAASGKRRRWRALWIVSRWEVLRCRSASGSSCGVQSSPRTDSTSICSVDVRVYPHFIRYTALSCSFLYHPRSNAVVSVHSSL